MTDIAELLKRVQQFSALKLPGQPQFMHMGTSYLVSDLWRALQDQAKRVAELELQVGSDAAAILLGSQVAAELRTAHPAGFTKAKERAVELCIDLAAKWEKVDPALARGAGPKEGCIDCADAIRAMMEPE